MTDGPTERQTHWASTMFGYESGVDGVRLAHEGSKRTIDTAVAHDRSFREELQESLLGAGATRAVGGGDRAREEEPDEWRTCFERDRDRILHSNAFRRLAGKTQVFVFPADHQRTRLTHALEVAQVAVAMARSCGLNVDLTEAIALGHDCGHGPGGHASEDALTPFIDGGFDHAVWGADVALTSLNLCRETLDGIRNHSWSRPAPSTPEGEVVGIADRVAYCAHDLEDAISANIVSMDDLPVSLAEHCGRTRSRQLRTFIADVTTTTLQHGFVAMSDRAATALGELRKFNYDNIYMRDDSRRQGAAVISLLAALVEHYADHPDHMPAGDSVTPHSEDAVTRAVTYVGGMTDRFACVQAMALLDWPEDQLPRGLSVVE